MAKKDVEQASVRISIPPPPDSTVKQVDDVFIVITEAYCPHGHTLITPENETFDGFPGIKLKIDNEHTPGILYLSPLHGDNSKKGDVDWKEGQALSLCCPECGIRLPTLAKCHCHLGNDTYNGNLVKLYTSSALIDSHILAFCNVWGCRHSRTIDNWNIISEYFDGQISD